MPWLRSNADLALMAVGLGAGSLAYASERSSWASLSMPESAWLEWRRNDRRQPVPLGWIGLVWLSAELWTSRCRKTGMTR